MDAIYFQLQVYTLKSILMSAKLLSQINCLISYWEEIRSLCMFIISDNVKTCAQFKTIILLLIAWNIPVLHTYVHRALCIVGSLTLACDHFSCIMAPLSLLFLARHHTLSKQMSCLTAYIKISYVFLKQTLSMCMMLRKIIAFLVQIHGQLKNPSNMLQPGLEHQSSFISDTL